MRVLGKYVSHTRWDDMGAAFWRRRTRLCILKQGQRKGRIISHQAALNRAAEGGISIGRKCSCARDFSARRKGPKSAAWSQFRKRGNLIRFVSGQPIFERSIISLQALLKPVHGVA